MQRPETAKAVGLVLAAWKLYWLARSNLIEVSKAKINDHNFPMVSQALSKAACEGFKVGKFKNQVKGDVLPFLKKLSARELRGGLFNDGPYGPSGHAGDEEPADS